jgi:hypothetical protein
VDFICVRFTTKWPPNPTSPVIARLGGSKVFSHTMNIVGNEAFEATMQHGCRVVQVEKAMQGVAMYQDMYVPVPYLAAAVSWGREQDGKRYDYAGAIGIPILMSEEWADEGSWWCSELCFMQIYKGGTAMLDLDVVRRVAPIHLQMCNFVKGPVVRLR